MATVVKLNLRSSCNSEDPAAPDGIRHVPAFTEEVDLDDLTPKARAFAEAIHACPGHQPLDIRLRTGRLKGDSPNFAIRFGDDPVKAAEPEEVVVRNWSPLRADSPMSAVEWLEREIRTVPLDAYPVGPAGGAPVPSMEAGAADRYLTRDTILEYMREAGHPMDVSAWDTLRGTGHLPEPDRYVCGRPQWKPDTIDAFLNRPVELWPISQVAEYLGYSGDSATGSARKQLHRWGLTPASRAPGRGGESLYAADQITAAQTHRPGKGRRNAQRSDGRFTSADGQATK
ncbi:hypothetical protein ACIBBE_43510 [Streptomyces sp. NPDC051644]|uniref:hypothetical protein n=1 Tax=Streptomyces sp. NPDC051644 TaxID=3365666 RepID=UPI0037AF9007